MPSRINAHINPDILRWARESINMGTAEAAERIGTSRDRLVDWEEGKEFPSIQQMRKASQVYKRPLAAFYLPEPPRFQVPKNDFRRLPETDLGTYPPSFLLELRRMQFQREVALALAEETERQPIESLLGSVTDSERATDVGRRVRKLLGIDITRQTAWRDEYEALNAWKDAIEKLGVLVFHFERVPLSVARGVSLAELPLPFIGVNGRDTPQAWVFTLLHEFCHLLMIESGVCDTRERRRAKRPQDEIETYCNRVAGAAILPGPALLAHPMVRRHGPAPEWNQVELRAIADHFKVSMEVVARRLLALGKSSPEHYQQQRAALAAMRRAKTGGPIPMARRVIRRVGQPYARIVIGAYYGDRITGNDASEYLGAKLKWVPEIEALLAGPNVLTGGDR